MSEAVATLNPPRRVSRSTLRLDIQALRAIAVAIVVIYHVWPPALPGGYVGVDMFFVISGYLIVGHLFRGYTGTGTTSLRMFWARRIFRLLPAAFVVVLFSVLAMFLLLPESLWKNNLWQAVASMGYVQNWALAAQSVDYLAIGNDPTLFQHFWSLSVEEQFYLAVPLLLTGLMSVPLLKRGSGDTKRRAAILLLAGIASLSFIYSVYLTIAAPEIAYFSTFTRAWEFALGGCLAVIPQRFVVTGRESLVTLRRCAAWLGLGFIALAAFTFSGETLFPSPSALLPVAGTLLVLWAHPDERGWSPMRIGNVRPFQAIGNWSYSIYLWHWPLVILYPHVRGHEPGLLGGAALIAASVALGAASMRYVEQPFRTAKFWQGSLNRAYPVALTMLVVVAATAVTTTTFIDRSAQKSLDFAVAHAGCLGAAALTQDTPGCDSMPPATLVPQWEFREDDTSGQYACWMSKDATAAMSCAFGDKDSAFRIALLGDSHAASLLPALVEVADTRGWRVDTYTGWGCGFADVLACAAGADIEETILAEPPDVLLVTSARHVQAPREDLLAGANKYESAGIVVIPVVDVPWVTEATTECAEAAGDTTEILECTTPINDALQSFPDGYDWVATEIGRRPIDFTSLMCNANDCPIVIGNVVVYRDLFGHITSTFSRSLASSFDKQITAALKAANLQLKSGL